MKKDFVRFCAALLLGLPLFLVVSCGGGGGGSSESDTSGISTANFEAKLTDASSEDYQAVYVTIDSVMVSKEEDVWETVLEPQKTYDLLELVNGVRESLGMTYLDPGIYTQMRLIIGTSPGAGLNIFNTEHPFANYVIDKDDGEVHELKIPSGEETGVKIVATFEIVNGETTELILDFDAMRSVVKAGSSGQYLLKPTVKVLETTEFSLVSGTVFNSAVLNSAVLGSEILPESYVTAQTADDAAADDKDLVVIETGTISDENGEYALFLAPDAYNLVATKAGYNAACFSKELAAGEIAVVDLGLQEDSALPGTVSGSISLPGASDEQYATIDFRQEVNCQSEGAETLEMVTVKTINIANGGDYVVELPAGTYQIVAWSYDKVTETYDITVVSDVDTPQNITLN